MGDDLEMTLNNSKVSDECKAEAVTVDDSLWAEVKLYVAKFFKLEPGVVLAKGEGFYLPVPKILTYEPGLVRTVLAPYISSDITVCYSVYNWLHHLGYVAYAICLMLFLIAYGFTDNQPGAAGACSDSDPSRNRAMCQLNGVLLDAKTEFRFLIAFILSGYVGVSVSIWAKRRSNYASLCGCARNLNLVVASVLPIDSKNTELCELRKKLARWVMLAMELAMLKARGHMDSNEGRDYLINSGLALKNEWDAMVKGDRHTTVFWWIMNEFTTMGRAGKLDAPYVILVSETVGVMRAQANDLMSSLDRDKPYSYTALCGLLVTINLFLMSTWKAVDWAIWYHSMGERNFTSEPRFWVDVLVLLSWNISYASLYDLGYMLHNPFGNRRIDVAHEVIFNGIRKLSTELAIGNTHLPKP